MADTRAEQETGFRWDNEGRTLEAWTADPRVAGRWRRAGFVVDVLGRTREGEPRTWQVNLPWNGHKRPWSRLFTVAVPRFKDAAEDGDSSSAGGDFPPPEEDKPADEGDA